MKSVISFLLVVFSQNLAKGEAIAVSVRCDDEAAIYVDESLVGKTDHLEDVWTGNISGKSRLIAIQCYNKGGPGGLIASFGERVVTDETWRCWRRASTFSWRSLLTDDSSWPWTKAYVIPAGDYLDTWNTFPGNAKWIWDDQYYLEYKGTLQCRGELGISVRFKFSDYGIVHADGVEMFRRTDGTQGKNIVPRATHVVAIEGRAHGNDSSIEAVFSNGFRTDASWKCTEKEQPNWRAVDYDDSHWDQAVDQGLNGIGADFGVRKIWTTTVANGSIFCRGHLECGCEYKCEVDENEYDFRCICPDGYVIREDGFSCDKDECQEQNAGCDHICVNIDGSYKCECRQGYELSPDMHSCININECDRNEHNCSSVCKDTEGAFECSCHEGSALQEDKTSCDDVNECEENNGNCAQGCANTEGSYICYCTMGCELAGDLHSCSNINECEKGSHNCTGAMLLCEDTDGGFSCVCQVGYKLDTDMATCQDIDECRTQDNPCEHGCINTVGSYMCNCSNGYSLANDGHACLLSGEGGGVDLGMIAGIVVAFMTITIVTILLVIFLIRRRQRHSSKETRHDTLDHVYYNVGRDNLARDTARAQPSEPPHEYYNVGRVSRIDGVPYENVLQRETNEAQEALEHEASGESAAVQKHVNRSEHTEEQVGTGNVSHEPPHVYYNVGRVRQNDEIPYEDVGGLRAGITEKETDLSTQGQGQNEYSSLSRETRDDGDASPYTQLA